ncbi:hypothetical protein FACS1894130_10740 [Spirochaetia bacterium]|nr:hypothetical protein FACS1894130_10740 [Spirochaetia bacterium]
MEAIKSVVINEKKNKKIIYSFVIDDANFEAHYVMGKKQTLEIFQNGNQILAIDKPKEKRDCIVNFENNDIKIVAWMEQSSMIPGFVGKINGVGIEIDGIPVQSTLADPEVHLKNGRTGLYVLLAVLGLKTIMTYYNSFKAYSSHIVAGIIALIYFIPLIITLIDIVKFMKWTLFAIISGLIISILEFADYLVGLPDSIKSGTNGMTLLIFILIRVSIIYLLFVALKWKGKNNKDIV